MTLTMLDNELRYRQQRAQGVEVVARVGVESF